MPRRISAARVLGGVVLTGLALLAACTTPPPPPPPPPPVVIIPPKPMPPMGAPAVMTIPPVNATGERHTVNTGISTSQTVWNLRSAYNVAALNCTEVKYAPILEGYKRFLKLYDKSLDRANREIDASFKTQHKGREAIKARETYQTQVYNFFSLPPAGDAFCEAGMQLTTEIAAVEPGQFDNWSYTGLAMMEKPFKDFFNAYEQYRADLAAWESRYGTSDITVRASLQPPVAQPTAVPQ